MTMTHSATRFTIAAGALAALLLAPTTAWANPGLAGALLFLGFTVHLIATSVVTFICTLKFGKDRKLKVFFLSFATTFALQIALIVLQSIMNRFHDLGLIGLLYILSVIGFPIFFTALYCGALKREPPAPDNPPIEW